MNLNINNVQDAADRLGCDPACILAITKVETPYPHVGNYTADLPIILNERHWFYRLSGSYPVSEDYPHLSQPDWGGYCTGSDWKERQAGEHQRLEEKRTIYDGALEEPALKSISMGLFQVMGFNHNIIGYNSVVSMWEDACKDDDTIDLEWFVAFVKAKGLDDPLRRLDWRDFARQYNGPSYRKNQYHKRLKKYYKRFTFQIKKDAMKETVAASLKKFDPLPPKVLNVGFPDFSQGFQRFNT